MEEIPIPTRNYPADVRILNIHSREFIIIGTAHISQESTNLVKQVIQQERPDTVCVELDEARYKALAEEKKWESLDLKEVIRRKQLPTLFVNLILASYQKKLGRQLGVTPGTELLEATKAAQALDIPIELCDRDVRITLRRAWSSMSFIEKLKLMSSGIVGMFETQEISEEMLAKLRQKDVLTELMTELGELMPALKTTLLDERDVYIAQKTKQAPGQKVVSVVGAGHLEGICRILSADTNYDLSEIEQIPPAKPIGKIIGWSIPIIIIGALIAIGVNQGASAAGENALYWFLANGIPSAIGAALAMGHPLTILAAFLSAPFTSLTPVIGAGYVTAFVQAYVRPPTVKEFQTVSDDVGDMKKWWQNKLLRILLVFIFASLGSIIGTYVGAVEIISNLFQ